MLATAPGHNATVLVAFATIAGMPRPTSAGNVSNVPPPAIELTAPPMTAATRTKASRIEPEGASGGVMGRRRKHSAPSAAMPLAAAVRYFSPHIIKKTRDRLTENAA